jgi:hypothetical protein
MDENKAKNSWQRIPDVVKAWLGLLTVIVGVIIAIRNEKQLYAVIVSGLIIVIWLGVALYIVFARRPGSFSKIGPYRYETHRWIGFLSIGLILGIILSFSLFTPNRSFVSGALLGTPTPIITPTIIDVTATPILTLTPPPTLTEIPTATTTATATATPAPVILFQENFINNNNGWELTNFSSSFFSIDKKIIGGKLIYSLACQSSYSKGCTDQIEIPNTTAKDFDLSFDTKVTDIDDNDGNTPLLFQVLFRKAAGAYYQVSFSNKGKVSVYLTGNRLSDYIAKDVYSNYIDQGVNNANHFRIIAQSSTFIIYANGQEIYRLEDGNNSSKGKISLGMTLGSGSLDRSATVEVDNILLQEVH